ncbi:hypothetical protein K3217_21125 [bacterium BD-1]|nr:hypothetical protein [Ottowia caeni]
MKAIRFLCSALILVAAQFAFASTASAQMSVNVGDFYCAQCTTFPGNNVVNTPEIHEFIYTDVNRFVSSWVTRNGTPRKVIICNGTKCAEFTYVKLSGQWRQTSEEFDDEHDPNEYSNTTSSGGASGAGYYYWGGSLWIYFGQSGCIGCVYFGEVGRPTPAPEQSEP